MRKLIINNSVPCHIEHGTDGYDRIYDRFDRLSCLYRRADHVLILRDKNTETAYPMVNGVEIPIYRRGPSSDPWRRDSFITIICGKDGEYRAYTAYGHYFEKTDCEKSNP